MRIVKHLGGRTVAAQVGDPTVLAVMPVLRGEKLAFLDYEFYGCEQADEPPEQPRLVRMGIGYIPGTILTGTITTATITAQVERYFGQGLQAEQGLGGDPNASADEEHWVTSNGAAVFGGRVLWAKDQLTVPIVGTINGATVEGTLEAKHTFRAKGTLKGGTFRDAGMIVMWVYNPFIAAQTDFGVAELDDQVSIAELYEALKDGNVVLNSDAAKVQELLFGGDTFVEADTVKEFAGRVFVRATAGLVGWERTRKRLQR